MRARIAGGKARRTLAHRPSTPVLDGGVLTLFLLSRALPCDDADADAYTRRALHERDPVTRICKDARFRWPKESVPTSRTFAAARGATASACACEPAPADRSSPRVAVRAAPGSAPETTSRALSRRAPGVRRGLTPPRNPGGTVPCARLRSMGGRGRAARGWGRRSQPGQTHPAGSLATGIAAGHRRFRRRPGCS